MNPQETTLRRNQLIDNQLGNVPTASYTAPITSSALNSASPISITNPAPATGSEGLQAFIGADTTSSLNDAQKTQDLATQQAGVDSKAKAYTDLLTGQQTPSDLQGQAYGTTNQLGTTVNQTADSVRKAGNEILAEQNSARRQIESLQTNGNYTKEQLAPFIQEINRKSTSLQADLYIKKLALQGDYESAKSIADRSVEAKYEFQQNQINAAKFTFENNKDQYTKKEQRQYNEVWDKKQRELDTKKSNDKIMEDTKIELLKSANEQGAPQSVKDAISRSTNAEQAINAAGIYGQDQLRRLQIQKAQNELVKSNKDGEVLSINDAKSLGVPYGTTRGQAAALNKVPGATSESGALKVSALQSATELLNRAKKGEVQTGFRSAFGTIPGTTFRDTSILFNNLKALLSLDNIKYLKGQGQISDAERLLLAQASSRLDRSLSGKEFDKVLTDVVKSLSGEPAGAPVEQQEVNGVIYEKGADGLYYPKK